MKIIGIYCYVPDENFKWDERNYEQGKVGGSEIWAIELSKEFAKRGHDVYVFGNPETEHNYIVGDNAIKYKNISSFKKICSEIKFDEIILSRTVKPIIDNEIVNCDNVYIMAHDTEIVNYTPDFNIDRIKKIFYQSAFQLKVLKEKYNIPENKFTKTFQAIDHTLYEKYSNLEKKNKMLFSQGPNRGLRMFMENVFPLIKKEIPDFEVDICSWWLEKSDVSSLYKQDGVNILNNIPREELIKRQCESKIWVYINHGYDSEYNRNEETFSITTVENAFAKNACILGPWGCFYTTLNDYDGFICADLFDSIWEPMEYDRLEEFYKKMAEDAIKCLKDENYRLSKVKSSYDCVKDYTWENVAKTFETEFLKINKDDIKVLLCCIGRFENDYIREFVEYNKNLGFTNICLYDNNRDGEDDFHDVIGDYIDNGYVILKDYRNITEPCQNKAYNECYAEYGNKYDWIAFLDIDEFIFLHKHRTIKGFLSDNIFDNFDMVHLNWLMYGDEGMVYNNGLPLLQRIKTPLNVNLAPEYKIPDTFHIKSIIRGGLDKITFKTTPHTPMEEIKCCTSFGLPCDSKSPFVPYDFRNGGIMHFTTKTAEEFAKKIKRGFCDGNQITQKHLLELFFKRNEVTKEKVDLFNKELGIDMGYLLPYDGEKREDVRIFSLCYERKDFKFLDDSVVTPLQVGAANNMNVCNLKDNTGDNISDKNYFFIESTGTYWIWKNIENAKYKGQMQYRRPLSGVNETMDFEKIFKNYDVITCEPFNHPENSKPTKEQPMCIPAKTVEEGYAFSNCIDDLYILEVAIKHFYPEYAEDYDKYIKHGENLYYSNGFIMKSEDFDRYSEFLFSCLQYYLDLANLHTQADLIDHVKYNMETGKYIRYEKEPITEAAVKWQSEIGGFLSERIWTLWLQHNFSNDRIYKLPYIKMEENMYT